MKTEEIPKPPPCEVCEDKGWVLANNNVQGLRVEKCDACEKYQTDQQAEQVAFPILNAAAEAVNLCKQSRDFIDTILMDFDDVQCPENQELWTRLSNLCQGVEFSQSIEAPHLTSYNNERIPHEKKE